MPGSQPDDVEARLSAGEREVAQLRSRLTVTTADAAAAGVPAAGADHDRVRGPR